MVKVREAQSVKDSRLVDKIENSFVKGVEQNSLITLSLDDLAMRFVDIGRQAHLLQGQILLEARNRFPSDKEFGQWCTLSLCEGSMQHRNRLMNLARYFKDREILGISLTVAYEISAPANTDIADVVYEYTKGKNLKVVEVKEKIAEFKIQAGIPLIAKDEKMELLVLADELQKYKDVILDDIKKLSNQDAICVLKSCLKEFQQKKEIHVQDAEVVTTQEPETIETSPASEDTGNNS
jgi:hypothetical protein